MYLRECIDNGIPAIPVQPGDLFQILFHVQKPFFSGSAKGTDERDTFRTGIHVAFLGTAVFQGGYGNLRTDIKHADSLGRMDFMAAGRQKIHLQFMELDRYFTKALDGIAVDKRVGMLPVYSLGNLPHGKNLTSFVVYMHHGNENGVLTDSPENILCLYAVCFRRGSHVGDGKALFFQSLTAGEYRAVLNGRGHNMTSHSLIRQGGTPDGNVVAFCSAGGKIDRVRGSSDKPGRLVTRVHYSLIGIHSKMMERRRIAITVCHKIKGDGRNIRVGGSRGAVVKVNQKNPSCS